MKPGVVTGSDYVALVESCKKEGYALPAVNVVGTNSVNAVLEAASKARSDVIIQVSNGGAQFFAGKGLEDSSQAKITGAVSMAQHVHLVAEHYGICVALHTDHANRKLLPWIDGLIEQNQNCIQTFGRPLFSSHMIDLSEEPVEENVDEKDETKNYDSDDPTKRLLPNWWHALCAWQAAQSSFIRVSQLSLISQL